MRVLHTELGREIAIVLAVKFLALLALWVAFFRNPP
ncbi:MAG: cytochrome oxidase putative small subunit CydP [Betaproteobacteria bacterium]